MTNKESVRRYKARKRGENIPKLRSWEDVGKGVYKWPADRVLSWVGEGNPNWKGDAVSYDTARNRAQRWYRLGPCEVCGSLKTERHHKDSNPLNNKPENISILCRRHHMEVDGRRDRLIERIIASNKEGPKGIVRDLRNKMRITNVEANPGANPDTDRLSPNQ